MASEAASNTSKALPAGYTVRHGCPSPEGYNLLRGAGNLTVVSPAHAAAACAHGDAHGWQAVLVHWAPGPDTPHDLPDELRADDGGYVVGMGRVFGNGAWYWTLADVVVHPEHRRRGLGDAIVQNLLQGIRTHAPDGGRGGLVSLLADPPGVGVYRKCGFEDAMASRGLLGMGFWL